MAHKMRLVDQLRRQPRTSMIRGRRRQRPVWRLDRNGIPHRVADKGDLVLAGFNLFAVHIVRELPLLVFLLEHLDIQLSQDHISRSYFLGLLGCLLCKPSFEPCQASLIRCEHLRCHNFFLCWWQQLRTDRFRRLLGFLALISGINRRQWTIAALAGADSLDPFELFLTVGCQLLLHLPFKSLVAPLPGDARLWGHAPVAVFCPCFGLSIHRRRFTEREVFRLAVDRQGSLATSGCNLAVLASTRPGFSIAVLDDKTRCDSLAELLINRCLLLRPSKARLLGQGAATRSASLDKLVLIDIDSHDLLVH